MIETIPSLNRLPTSREPKPSGLEEPLRAPHPKTTKNPNIDPAIDKISKEIKQESKPKFSSEFTNSMKESLQACGILVDYVDPTPIAEGANHIIYKYALPEQSEKVIKVSKPKSTTTMTDGKEGEEKNIETAEKYFGKYVAKTEVKHDPKNPSFYCIVQETIKGQSLSNEAFKDNPSLAKQLEEIILMNQTLYEKENISLDFVGMAGFLGWVNKQKGKFFLRKSLFEVSNIIVDEKGNLKIIDFEYFKYRKTNNLLKRVKNFVGLTVNRALMKHYFKMDIKKK